MAFVSVDKVDQVVLATETGDDGTLTDKTPCMTDDSSSTSCIEIKAAQAARVEVDRAAEALSSVTIRIGVESVMTSGTLRVAPYTDSNSISDTNGATTGTISGGGNEDRTVTANFITDAEQGNGQFIFRVFENGSGAKIKTGEIDIEMTVATVVVAGISKDDDDAIVVSCSCQLWKKISATELKFVEEQTSDGTTGAYSFSVDDDSSTFRVLFEK